MNVETVGDVVQWSGDFHQSFAQFLPDSIASSSNERAKLLGDDIARHEANLATTILALKDTESKNSLDTWVTEFLNNQPLPDTKYKDLHWASLSSEQLLDEVLEVHAQLIELYRHLHSRCAATPAAGTLEQLLDMEEQELSLISHSANRLRDL
ncbi:hypothetical protein IMCC21906_03051 [Spongiibacter sp. IMCC21906]|jgi:hypothetical protein|uniref:hypothetical protein n=1 Tax=Spongiibacter sp. IMCC21906 TaxID=1620392 RepID=UPI00062DCDFD|nr:hypothetical protein [Spongiibacter sp. IMCC21906]AKH70691.1 hypothetical protein IMCC21906_03051 [Spongiibacter sp. IMCC21906]